MKTSPIPPCFARVAAESVNKKNYGSGTWTRFISGGTSFLTSAHLFEPDVTQITVFFPGLAQISARLLVKDLDQDVAVLDLDPEDMQLPEPMPVAVEKPELGERLFCGGFGRYGKFLFHRGVFCGYKRFPGCIKGTSLIMTGSARMGDSGGPVWNEARELVAVLWGTDRRVVCGGTVIGMKEI